MTDSAQATRTKFCSGCGFEWPLDDFHRQRSGSERRRSQCRRCLAKERTRFNHQTRQAEIAAFAKDVVACGRDRNKLIRLTGELFRTFGDYRGVARHWKAAFDGARAAGRHLTASKLILAVADLGIVAGELQREQVRSASDADLEEQAERGMVRLVRERPELVLAAARQSGWSVHPP